MPDRRPDRMVAGRERAGLTRHQDGRPRLLAVSGPGACADYAIAADERASLWGGLLPVRTPGDAASCPVRRREIRRSAAEVGASP